MFNITHPGEGVIVQQYGGDILPVLELGGEDQALCFGFLRIDIGAKFEMFL